MPAPSGFDDVNNKIKQHSIAAHPCKKRKDGAPQWEWCAQGALKVGHPP